MADQRRSVVAAFVATIVASGTALVAPVIIGRAVDTYIRNRDFAGVLRSAAMLLARLPRRAGRHLRADAADGDRRPSCAVQPPERALHEAAAAAARLLQPEQGRRSDLANQQRHGQAQSVLLAGARAAGGEPVPHGGRRHLPPDAQPPARPRGARAGSRRARAHACHRRLGEAAEHGEPAGARRPERRDPGEHEQLQGHRRLQPRGLLPASSSTRRTSGTTRRR